MSEMEVIPQKLSFKRPSVIDVRGNIKSSGIRIITELDTPKADRQMVKKNLESVSAEVLDYFEMDEEEKEQREDGKHKVLLCLEGLWVDENERINKYTLEGKWGYPKEGLEEKGRQATKRSDMLIKIMKLVQREMKALSISKKREVKGIVGAILNESATAHIKETAESAEVTITNVIERRILANLEVRISPNGCLMIDGCHLLTGSDK